MTFLPESRVSNGVVRPPAFGVGVGGRADLCGCAGQWRACWRSSCWVAQLTPKQQRKRRSRQISRDVVIAAKSPAYRLKGRWQGDNFAPPDSMPATAVQPTSLLPIERAARWTAGALSSKRRTLAGGGRLAFRLRAEPAGGGPAVPLWGMTSIEARLVELLDEYQPRQLIILGDLVHDRAPTTAASELARRGCASAAKSIVLAGNHDRHARATIEFVTRWETPDSSFITAIARPEDADRHPDHRPSSSGGDDHGWGRVAA